MAKKNKPVHPPVGGVSSQGDDDPLGTAAPLHASFKPRLGASKTTATPALEPDSADAPLKKAVGKRKRPSKDESTALASLSTKKRVALGSKTANPNSSDNSLLRSLDKPKGSKGGLLHNDIAEKENPVGTSLLQGSAVTTGPARKLLATLSRPQDAEAICDFLKQDAAQAAADLISRKGCWSPGLIELFRESSLKSLDLSSPSLPSGVFIPHTPPTYLLQVLFHQNHFMFLTTISLRNTQLGNDDVALLRVLSSLANLDLCNTGISSTALYYLVCHHYTLTTLNIAMNEAIDSTARHVISALPRLSTLYLRGVSFDMPALRKLVEFDLAKGCRLLSIPAPCVAYLNTRGEHYAVDLPQGFVQDPAVVPAMTMSNLKKNLDIHQKANPDVQVTGPKVELVSRLTAILWNRLADARILEVLGRA